LEGPGIAVPGTLGIAVSRGSRIAGLEVSPNLPNQLVSRFQGYPGIAVSSYLPKVLE
jgi:hypothetical protein